MALEDITAGHSIANLVTTNPGDGDDIAQGDDHIRNVKKALQFTWPNINATVSSSPAEMDLAHKGGTISGSLRIMDTLSVSGAAVLKSTLLVEDAATISGAMVLKSGLTVEGTATFSATAVFKTTFILDGAIDGGVLIGNSTGAIQVTTAGVAGTVLTSNGTGNDPTFQNAPLTNQSVLGGIDISPTYLNLGNESDGAISHDATSAIANTIYQCTNFEVQNAVVMTFAVINQPLIILCTGTCTITGEINASGKGNDGAVAGQGLLDQLSFGGSGGGGSGDADNTTGGGGGVTFKTTGGAGGSTDGAGGVGQTLDSAALAMLSKWSLTTSPWHGGGAGGRGGDNPGNGGDGGGTVIIIADTIDFTGEIDVSGTNGGSASNGSGGGGGGGLILMAANTYSADTGTRTVTGGSGGVSGGRIGGNGGAGTVITITL